MVLTDLISIKGLKRFIIIYLFRIQTKIKTFHGFESLTRDPGSNGGGIRTMEAVAPEIKMIH
jgi:hypothetical protein